MHDHGVDSRITFSDAQRQRLAEMSLHGLPDPPGFPDVARRDQAFEALHRELLADNVRRLDEMRTVTRRPLLRRLEAAMAAVLSAEGFVEVVTPVMIGKGSLEKMGLGPDHPLWRQVYWVDRTRCLRPMLAPNLYYLLSHLQRLWPLPVRIFEVGSCFRKESKGSSHLSEFTMLNMVELGPGVGTRERLTELAALVMGAIGMDFELRATDSDVYGATLDMEVAGLEVASGVAGPNPLDEKWGISDAWAGWGFGLERLAMAREGSPQIRRFGRGLMYLDGARLNVQPERRSAPGEIL
jgi:phenylalanyl-tRNA synthetase alpha chain